MTSRKDLLPPPTPSPPPPMTTTIPSPPPSASYFRIVSAWSKAGVGTSVVLETRPSPRQQPKGTSAGGGGGRVRGTRVALDIGSTPRFDDAIPASAVLISHGHVDHIGGAFSHARAHSVAYGGSAPTYYVPHQLAPKLEEARRAVSDMDALCCGAEERDEGGSAAGEFRSRRDGSLMTMKIVGVRPGDEIELKQRRAYGGRRLILRSFAVDHGGHPALGYVLLTRRTLGGLKEEYRGLSGEEIRDLVRSGVKVRDDRSADRVEAVYTGDASAAGLLRTAGDGAGGGSDPPSGREDDDDEAARRRRSRSYMSQGLRLAPLLICEATFLGVSDSSLREAARIKGHMHALDVVDVLRSHGWDASEDDDDGGGGGGGCPPGGETAAASVNDPEKVGSGTVDDGDAAAPADGRRLVLFHISGRYAPARRALDDISECLPLGLARSCDVAIASLMSDDERRRGEHGEEPLVDLVREDGCVRLVDYWRWKEKNKRSLG